MKLKINGWRALFVSLVVVLALWVLLFRFPGYYIAKWMAKSEMVRVLQEQGLDPERLGELKQVDIGNARWGFVADYKGKPPKRVGVRIGYDGHVEYFSERVNDTLD